MSVTISLPESWAEYMAWYVKRRKDCEANNHQGPPGFSTCTCPESGFMLRANNLDMDGNPLPAGEAS
jgi:hypothetical protein